MILIIPMRGGSKRLKDKNIQKIVVKKDYVFPGDNGGRNLVELDCNKYMFEMVYKTAVNTKLYDKIIFAVDKKYEKIVRGTISDAEIYVRNKKNSRDKSPLIDLVREIVTQYDINDKYMTILYATSILTTEKHLIDAYKDITENNYSCVFPIVDQQFDFNYRAGDGYHTTYGARHADAFFMFHLQRALDNNKIISDNNDGFITVGELEYQDVHTAEDIEILKKKYNLR